MCSANTSNRVRKIDPFSIATSAVSKAQESTAASVNGNPVAGNPGKGGPGRRYQAGNGSAHRRHQRREAPGAVVRLGASPAGRGTIGR